MLIKPQVGKELGRFVAWLWIVEMDAMYQIVIF